VTKQETLKLKTGDKVFCTVYGAARGWYRVLVVRPRDGYIKIAGGGNAFCPPHNFSLTDPTHAAECDMARDLPPYRCTCRRAS